MHLYTIHTMFFILCVVYYFSLSRAPIHTSQELHMDTHLHRDPASPTLLDRQGPFLLAHSGTKYP